MVVILSILGFAAVMVALNYMLRRRERDGDFDPQSPSSAARAGLKTFFDYRRDGFGGDGMRQQPPRREDHRG